MKKWENEVKMQRLRWLNHQFRLKVGRAWAKAMALLKKEEDKGAGDTVYRMIGPSVSAEFQKWYLRIFGKSCECSQRHLR